jgi:hypothetical protein
MKPLKVSPLVYEMLLEIAKKQKKTQDQTIELLIKNAYNGGK